MKKKQKKKQVSYYSKYKIKLKKLMYKFICFVDSFISFIPVSKDPKMFQKDDASLPVAVSIGVVMFLVPEVEDCFGCVFVVDLSYNVLRISTDWDDDNQIVVLSLFDSVATEEEYEFRDDWDKCIVGSVDNVIFEIFAAIVWQLIHSPMKSGIINEKWR